MKVTRGTKVRATFWAEVRSIGSRAATIHCCESGCANSLGYLFCVASTERPGRGREVTARRTATSGETLSYGDHFANTWRTDCRNSRPSLTCARMRARTANHATKGENFWEDVKSSCRGTCTVQDRWLNAGRLVPYKYQVEKQKTRHAAGLSVALVPYKMPCTVQGYS